MGSIRKLVNMLILISTAKLRVCHQSWYKHEGLLKCLSTASLFMDKGYGKTLENRLKKTRRMTLDDLVCLPKTKKRLQFSAAGNPLDNVKSKKKNCCSGLWALFSIKTLQGTCKETEEKSHRLYFQPSLPRNLTKLWENWHYLLLYQPIRKIFYYLPKEKKYQESHSLSWTNSNKSFSFLEMMFFLYVLQIKRFTGTQLKLLIRLLFREA